MNNRELLELASQNIGIADIVKNDYNKITTQISYWFI